MRLVLCLILVLAVSPAHAARKRAVKYPTPVVGKGTYTVSHPSVCKDGKCSIAR
jgi:hypothetical protein